MTEPEDPDGDVTAKATSGRHREHRWDAEPGDEKLIQEHLDRQRDVPEGRVKLDDGRIVDVGSDAVGEEGCDDDERD